MDIHDKKMMWDTIESNYWSSIKAARDREDQKLHEQLQDQQSEIKRKLAESYARRTQLTLELTTVKSNIEHLESKLDGLSEEFNIQKAKMEHDRANDDECQRSFFAKHRSEGGAPPSASHQLAQQDPRQPNQQKQKQTQDGQDNRGNEENHHQHQEHRRPDSALTDKAQDGANERVHANADAHHANSKLPTRNGVVPAGGLPKEGDRTGVTVVDSEGSLVGEIRVLGPHHNNRWIQGLLQLPVKQDAVLRPGRKLTEEQFQSIHEPTDAKGAKWIGVMIQAKGDIQRITCQFCNKHTGVFGDCVLIGGEDFPRCGNCEWSRQACHFIHGPQPPMILGPKPENGGESAPPDFRRCEYKLPTLMAVSSLPLPPTCPVTWILLNASAPAVCTLYISWGSLHSEYTIKRFNAPGRSADEVSGLFSWGQGPRDSSWLSRILSPAHAPPLLHSYHPQVFPRRCAPLFLILVGVHFIILIIATWCREVPLLLLAFPHASCFPIPQWILIPFSSCRIHIRKPGNPIH